MKSSTLHRSNLTREKMSLIENVKPKEYGDTSTDLNQYIKFQKKPELDVLWRNFEKDVQQQPKTRVKSPLVYTGVGFILGFVFASFIALIVGVSAFSNAGSQPFEKQKNLKEVPVSVMPASTAEDSEQSGVASEEKYTIKEGDTLDKVALRFYGKYDEAKINKIMELNNIKDPTRIQIGQVLIIPLN